MKARHAIAIAVVIGLTIGSASAYTYTVWKDDLPTFNPPSYSTIIPTDSPLRNPTQQGACNGDFSPNSCVNSIPEPGTYALLGLGLALMMMFRRVRA